MVVPNKLIAWARVSKPLFDMEPGFEQLTLSKSKISFLMIFGSVEECNKMKNFVVPNNEENFDRLERELLNMKGDTKNDNG